MTIVGKIKKFSNEVSVEMKKVTWPTKEQLKESTGIVCVFSIFFALFTFIIDQIVTLGVKAIF